MSTLRTCLTAASAALILTTATAQADALKARQGQMQLYAHNLGILGSMAKGAVDYDAAAASAAASNLATLAKLDQSTLWPQGTAVGDVEGSRALPELWSTYPAVLDASAALVTAADAMDAAAGQGLEQLQAAMGPLGGACGGCHKLYRQAD